MSERNIDDNDYNQLRNKIANVFGNGYTNRGYGQKLNSSRAIEGSLIRSDQWNAVADDLANTVIHQTGSFPTLPVFDNSRSINLTDLNNLNLLADTLDSNRFSVGAGRNIITTVARRTNTQPWAIRAQTLLTITFETSNDARYFFNSGGKIRFSSSRSGGTNTPQNSAWSVLLNSVGTLDFTGQSGVLLGFYDLTDSYQIWFQQNLSTPYSSNYFRIEMSSDVPSNITGIAKVLYFKITWEDLYAGPSDKIDGELSVDVSEIKAQGPLKNDENFFIKDPVYDLAEITPIGIPEKFYSLTVNKFTANAVNDVFTVTLNTFNVPDGEIVPYTISGVSSSDINGETLSGSFTVFNNTASQTFRTTSRDYVAIPVPVYTPVPVPVPVPAPVPPPPPPPPPVVGPSTIGRNIGWIKATYAGGGWGGFMNNYAIAFNDTYDIRTATFNTTFYIRRSGTYNIAVAIDNSGSVTINGELKRAGNTFGSELTYTQFLPAGVINVSGTYTNEGGRSGGNPGGIAVTVRDGPGGSLIWSTLGWQNGTYSYRF